MPTFPSIYIDGVRCLHTGPGVAVRSTDGYVGFFDPRRLPDSTIERGTRYDAEHQVVDVLRVKWNSRSEVAASANVPPAVIKARLAEGWSAVDITKPLNWSQVLEVRRNGITHQGVTYTLDEIAQRTRCTPRAIELRILQGWEDGAIVNTPRVRDIAPKNIEHYAAQGLGVPTEPAKTGAKGAPCGAFQMDGVISTVYGHHKRILAYDRANTAPGMLLPKRPCLQTVINRLTAGLTVEQAFGREDPGGKNGRKRRTDYKVPRGLKNEKTGHVHNFDRYVNA